MRIFVVLAPALLAAACSSTPDVVTPPKELRVLIGHEPVAIGVAVDPTGARFVFDRDVGLYQIDDQTATLVLPYAEIPTPDVAVTPPYTDLVAVGPGRFAITAIGEGYQLDLAARTMRGWFCYVPDGLPVEYRQWTDAVAYDAGSDTLFAQPRTYDENSTLLTSQISEYQGVTGTDFGWHDVATDVAAGGMAFLPDHGLVVANGTKLSTWNGTQLVELSDLAAQGVATITGLAVDTRHDTLLVVDDAGSLHELPLAEL